MKTKGKGTNQQLSWILLVLEIQFNPIQSNPAEVQEIVVSQQSRYYWDHFAADMEIHKQSLRHYSLAENLSNS